MEVDYKVVCISHTSKQSTSKALSFKHDFFFFKFLFFASQFEEKNYRLVGGDGGVIVGARTCTLKQVGTAFRQMCHRSLRRCAVTKPNKKA